MHYRREIDGLRAIAVVSVILCHAGLGAFRGGFVGVDVFFVISGYVITLGVREQQRQGSFTIGGFYERRVRRVLPALLLVMAACTPFALLWMLPDYLENFGQSVVATLLLGNNLLMLHTSGYFSLEAEFKPLLHTWSLGIEEQFYLLFPLLAVLAWRCRPRHVLWAVGGLMVISLALAQRESTDHALRAYYLLHTRAWELLLGIGAALVAEHDGDVKPASSSLSAQLAAWAGLLMIGYAIACFDSATGIPGLAGLVPAGGAVLVLHFAARSDALLRLLAHRWLVGVGLVSYSAYLWHQPLFAFARLVSLEPPSAAVFLALALCAFVLAYASWRFVEQPFRRPGALDRGRLMMFAGIGAGALASAGLYFHLTAGFVLPRRALEQGGADVGRWTNASYNAGPRRFTDRPFLGSDRQRVLVVGNSFARDFINAGLENGFWSNAQLSYSEGPLTCMAAASLPDALRQRISQSDYLIFGSPSINAACWRDDLRMLQSMGARRVLVIGSKHFGWNINAAMLLDAPSRRGLRAKVDEQVDAANTELARAVGPEHFVNQLQILSDVQGRVPVFTEDGKLISPDRRHLTRAGAAFVGKMLFEHPLLKPLKPL